MTEKSHKIKLSKERKEKLVKEIQAFFMDQREEEIGDLQAEMLTDLLIKKVGTEIYNCALYDARDWLEKRLDDLRADYYSLEINEEKNG